MAKREIPEINAGSMADIAFLLLIFFLVTTTMDKDTAYIRSIPKKIEVKQEPVDVPKRDICEILANNNNRLMFRGEILDNPDDISDKIVEFFSMNEALSNAQTTAALSNPGHPGYNFPFYVRSTKSDLMEKVKRSGELLDGLDEIDNPAPELIKFREDELAKWEEKLRALKMLGGSYLPEVSSKAHIRVVVQSKTDYELFAKIHSEIEEATYELRDKASKKFFGDSYGNIKSRRDLDKEDEKKDQPKLDLLKILYPVKIIEVRPR